MLYILKIINCDTDKVVQEYPPIEEITLNEMEDKLYKKLDFARYYVEVEEVP